MFTSKQAKEYNRFKKLAGFFDVHIKEVAAYLPFKEEAEDFMGTLKDLDNISPAKELQTGKGITGDKDFLKQKIADALAIICRQTASYALKAGNAPLAAAMNTRSYIIFKKKDADILPFYLAVREKIEPLLADDVYQKYGVTAKMLDRIGHDAQAFNNAIGSADVAQTGSRTANIQINTFIKKLQQNIVHFDLLVDALANSYPDFVQGYHFNTAVDNVSIRHSGIEGTVRDKNTGAPVAGALIKLAGTDKKAVSDLNGHYRIERVMPDDYYLEISAAGYAGQRLLHHITRGRIDVLNFEM